MSPSLAALCCLQLWKQRAAIPGGLAFEPLLRLIALDHSPASLARIDTFLEALRTAKKPQRDAFIAERASRNLLDLLAIYVGDVIGRALRCAPEWLARAPDGAASPPGEARSFEHSLVCNFPGTATCPGEYAPLTPICARLFTANRDHGVASSAGALLPAALRGSRAPLPPAPGFGYPLRLQEALARCSSLERTALDLAPPSPAAHGALSSFFAAAPEVLRSGHVAWGVAVQVDEALVRPRAEGGGLGDVVYDPLGRAPATALEDVSEVLRALQDQPVAEPSLPEFSAWLAGARPAASGLDVPALISPYPLKIAETWFAHRHLPGAVLTPRAFPVVTSKDHPGVVLFLPAKLWPAGLLQAWCA
ncbi:hypothetical protein GCM10028796_12360 [Ramlibacter monticola]|uniref:Uncharacterized protein n=1 Tax=Ramlibacter monticola TaxID=1926872 RepID=A0A936YW13_9BURK|nr:hypothetical protein [Ramlibacter monticola]MBL0390088.1 hypothetical protein [Ramlibacter monticola]